MTGGSVHLMTISTAASVDLVRRALGRGVEYYDAPTVDSIVALLNRNDGTMVDLINGIVESTPFQKRRGDGDRL